MNNEDFVSLLFWAVPINYVDTCCSTQEPRGFYLPSVALRHQGDGVETDHYLMLPATRIPFIYESSCETACRPSYREPKGTYVGDSDDERAKQKGKEQFLPSKT